MAACRLYKFSSMLLVLLITACSTLSSTPPVSLPANASLAILPTQNLSTTATADRQAEVLLENSLRLQGWDHVHIVVAPQSLQLGRLIDVRQRQRQERDWAVKAGYSHAIAATVHEWQYKQGIDREPTVGISLSLVELDSGRVLYQGNASRTGLGYANLPSVAKRVLDGLLEGIRPTYGQ